MAKRFLDILLSGMALLVFLPFGLLIALILRFTGEGEVFYRQARVGKNGKLFQLLKFATMLKDSPNLGSGLITVRNDPRVLPLGRFLRKTKLNEIPQLINVLKGDMSIVGPRPLAQRLYLFLPIHEQDIIYGLVPGLTGIGSLVFRDEEKILSESPKGPDRCYNEDIMPLKAKLELWYASRRSFKVDCLIILMTAWAVIRPGTQVHRLLLGKEWSDEVQAVVGSAV